MITSGYCSFFYNGLKNREIDFLYLVLAGIFIACLITCNLIANKFVDVDFGWLGFDEPITLSAGVLPYPLTFLITDILSEFYGKRKTNQVVLVGFFSSLVVLLILWVAESFPASSLGIVGDNEFSTVFSSSGRVIGASMTAYLVAQLIDVRLFHFWKKLTKGKHLWLRNNASTILSQFVDTTLVVLVLFAGRMSMDKITLLVWYGWIYKLLAALFDTPIIYGASWMIGRRFNLKFGEEFKE